jgi:DNA-binding NtrC family response regulator
MPPAKQRHVALALTVIEGPDAGTSVAVSAPSLVGTSEVCELRLTDRTVSRRHLRVEPGAVGLVIRDQDSRNGTWLGDVRVERVELPLGRELRIGGTRLRVDATQEHEPPREPPAARGSFGRFLGESPAARAVYATLERVAPSDATVLLEGESGTGKELLAESIHDHSQRAEGPLVVVDAGAMPATLIEAELFGHERGAFTGAERARAGAFERAHGGTVFLDEIGELPLTLQTRLLRVLDRRQVRRLGSSAPVDVDVRIVAATNRDLDREVEEQRFRLDLFHRLAVVVVQVPPLRERPADVEPLARHFIDALGGDPELLSPDVLERLRSHRWPGNVRELRNYIERLVLLGDAAPAARPASPAEPVLSLARSGLPYRQARARVLDAFTEAYVEHMLELHDGNVSAASRAAGIARRYFQQLKRGR